MVDLSLRRTERPLPSQAKRIVQQNILNATSRRLTSPRINVTFFSNSKPYPFTCAVVPQEFASAEPEMPFPQALTPNVHPPDLLYLLNTAQCGPVDARASTE
jgi:hypothetical protein